MDEEFLSCPQLVDLQCAYGSLKGFLKGNNPGGSIQFSFELRQCTCGTPELSTEDR